jgi:hypothetical protein
MRLVLVIRGQDYSEPTCSTDRVLRSCTRSAHAGAVRAVLPRVGSSLVDSGLEGAVNPCIAARGKLADAAPNLRPTSELPPSTATATPSGQGRTRQSGDAVPLSSAVQVPPMRGVPPRACGRQDDVHRYSDVRRTRGRASGSGLRVGAVERVIPDGPCVQGDSK